jgi:hypothetical protein
VFHDDLAVADAQIIHAIFTLFAGRDTTANNRKRTPVFALTYGPRVTILRRS